jgi:hypothetical protein
LIKGGAGIDTLKLAAGTSLNLAALTVNQTVTPIQEVEVIQMQGSSSVLTLTANDVLSLGGAASTMGGNYTFSSTTQVSGATGSTSSTGKVQFVVHGLTGDTLNLNALANDGVPGTGTNAGVLGNSSLAGSWSYMGQVTKTDAQGVSHTYKVYDHSTTGAQVLADVNVTVNTLSPITISAISTDSGTSSTDFVTNDPTLVFTGMVPAEFNSSTEKVHVKIMQGSTVVYEGDATLNGTNWTLDKTATSLAAGSYTIVAMIEDSSGNPVASYGALGTATHSLTVDTTTPTIALARSGSGTMSGAETITFTFSEGVPTGEFTTSDIDVSGGTISNLQPVNGTGSASAGYTQYTATFTPTSASTGTATIAVAAGKFADVAGNLNLDTYSAATTHVSNEVAESNNIISASFDTTPPSIAVTASSYTIATTTNNTITLTFTFNKAVNDFAFADIDLIQGGGTLSSSSFAPVSGTGDVTHGYTQYTVTYTPASSVDQIVKIGVGANKFSAGGQFNTDTYVAGTGYEANNLVSIDVNTTGGPSVTKISGGGQDAQFIGDVNGDGLMDFAIESSDGSTAYVVYGGDKAAMAALNLTNFNSSQGMKIYNSHDTTTTKFDSGTGLGHMQITAGGDLNRDGLADVIVSADNDTTAAGAEAQLGIYGTAAGSTVDVYNKLANNTTSGAVLLPYWYQASLSIAQNLGGFDFNGDGFDDSWVQTGGFAFNGNFESVGQLSLGNTSTVYGINSGTNATPAGLSTPAASGDVNGDGYDDLIVMRNTSYILPTANWSEVEVLFGNSGSAAWNAWMADANPNSAYDVAGNINNTTKVDTVGFRITGFDSIGSTNGTNGYGGVAEVTNDVNRDGLADVLIAATKLNTGSPEDAPTNSNEFYVVYGKTDNTAVSVADIKNGVGGKGMYIHYTVGALVGMEGDIANAGDFNGDGYDDFLITDKTHNAAYLIYGKAGGTASGGIELTTIGTSGTSDGFKIVGPSGGLTNADAIGDINGDGFGDVAYSDPTDGSTFILWGGQQVGTNTPNPFNALAGDKLGTSADDTLTGTTGANRIIGGLGNDTLIGNGGADVIYGGAGDDTIVLNASNLSATGLRVDAGGGHDTIKFDGSGIVINLSNFTEFEIGNFERLDITGSGNNELTLSMRDVVAHGHFNEFNVDTGAVDTRKQLLVTGDAGDTVHLGNLWTSEWVQPLTNGTFTENGHTYNVLNSVTGNAQLLIDQNITLGI